MVPVPRIRNVTAADRLLLILDPRRDRSHLDNYRATPKAEHNRAVPLMAERPPLRPCSGRSLSLATVQLAKSFAQPKSSPSAVMDLDFAK
jgi:hypothetical protein